MGSLIESAYFVTAMLGPGLLKNQAKGKRAKVSKNSQNLRSISVEIFLREILGTRLIQSTVVAKRTSSAAKKRLS